jgi:hypothetical protein
MMMIIIIIIIISLPLCTSNGNLRNDFYLYHYTQYRAYFALKMIYFGTK